MLPLLSRRHLCFTYLGPRSTTRSSGLSWVTDFARAPEADLQKYNSANHPSILAPPFPGLHAQFHKSLFPDAQVPGFGASYSCLWEVLRERISLPMMRALEDMLGLPRGASQRCELHRPRRRRRAARYIPPFLYSALQGNGHKHVWGSVFG